VVRSLRLGTVNGFNGYLLIFIIPGRKSPFFTLSLFVFDFSAIETDDVLLPDGKLFLIIFTTELDLTFPGRVGIKTVVVGVDVGVLKSSIGIVVIRCALAVFAAICSSTSLAIDEVGSVLICVGTIDGVVEFSTISGCIVGNVEVEVEPVPRIRFVVAGEVWC